jgi:NitT/TauT family transport system ATP-binding protein
LAGELPERRPLTAAAAPKLAAEGVRKEFATRRGSVLALEDVDLAVAPHEFVALVGPSGCGKSTLLRMFAGLGRPSRGRVLLDGRPVVRPTRDAGIVFQDHVLMPWRTVLDNVLLPAEIMGLDLVAADARARSLLARVGLQGFEDRVPSELSGGMRQRAAICRALLHEPSTLLMDEPFAALDALTREELGFELCRLHESERKTVLFVTHSIGEAVLLADRVVTMTARPGRIARVVRVELPRPREPEMVYSEGYKRAAEEIRSLIFNRGVRS